MNIIIIATYIQYGHHHQGELRFSSPLTNSLLILPGTTVVNSNHIITSNESILIVMILKLNFTSCKRIQHTAGVKIEK